ncbi:hypothetical protein DFH07DRAFT_848297 [Mycena maculata]|uniref:Uncharacterized protein n=1 Tax=Mycena maculata TaxID=230809 RepID=A0AAD7MT50_9AGAR|nr:hypothetical protein DFH07DRAFT_848297 [Mycena maculata]
MAAITIRRLANFAPRLRAGDFSPASTYILGQDAQKPSDGILRTLTQLATSAQAAAESAACASILAGNSTDGDSEEGGDGDVAVWLGPGEFGKGKEKNVLAQLGLDSNYKTSPVTFSPSGIPATVTPSDTAALKDFATKLEGLSDRHCFSVRPPDSSEVLFSLVGKAAGDAGWGGLVGIGTILDD